MTAMKLMESIEEFKEKLKETIPESFSQKINQFIDDLEHSEAGKGLPIGGKAPDFTLPDASGAKIQLSEELKKGPVVLMFYRGNWCPYCNLTLKAYQQSLAEIKAAGAQLMAISLQQPDDSLSMKEKNQLEFHVLSDVGGKVSEEYKLLFEMPEYLIDTYKEKNMDLTKINGTEKWVLPVPATFVIDPSGTIRFSHIEADYSKRAEPSEIVTILQSL